ncbi:hypothetical protein CGLO_00174 [Colletotrichum gloeosporioides Cg-14]|uniref:Uncharacterized protein n=1 Tax=Colletotrichum gloeosporioides (strain Cg-14) TaxID=1237896 RepID=T0MEF4_COLGC|nr:hypothetical protein CGLO_00174 [Colletotrichum gloeosporioides Cg-14]
MQTQLPMFRLLTSPDEQSRICRAKTMYHEVVCMSLLARFSSHELNRLFGEQVARRCHF